MSGQCCSIIWLVNIYVTAKARSRPVPELAGEIAKQPISPHNNWPKTDLSLISGFGQPVLQMAWAIGQSQKKKVIRKFWVFVYRNANDNHIIAATEEFSDESAPLRRLESSFEAEDKEVRCS
ncbi:hypothetical protein TNCT_283701 [Trichonephila clavata]|uniref:Uncharacterized protein n=1 Tax=Trichonephila clavata TaxID=2740835 RepID=A0A8X6GNJ3_TRICU|nr:hypothetical protein TNCT_283701 [Trichonephila clavata]